MQLLPYHQRRLLIIRQHDPYPNYCGVVANDRWWPLYLLLMLPGFTDYEIGALIGLKEEYEAGVMRKG